MQRLLVFAFIVLCSSRVRADHPVTRVITLLEGLAAQVKDQGNTEEVTYTTYTNWCSTSLRTLSKAVAEEKANIETLEIEIQGKELAETTLTKYITFLDNEITKYTNMGNGAEGQRNIANSLYLSNDADYDTTITAIDQAITDLQSAKTSTALIQTRLQEVTRLPLVLEQLTDGEQDEMLFLSKDTTSEGNSTNSTRDDILASGDYDDHAVKYSFKSNSIIELLKKLKMKFEDDKLEATKEETNAQNAYLLAKDARAAALAAANDAKGKKELLLGTVQGELVTKRGDLGVERDDLRDDSWSLGNTTQACAMKKSAWEERSKTRAMEIKSIKEGIEILAKATGVRTEAPTNPVPPPSPLLLLQDIDTDPRAKVVNLLRTEAKKQHSRTFEQFADELALHMGGSFDEVINLIHKMIFRLMAEQTDEDNHKNWCDLELEKTGISKSDKEDRIGTLDTDIGAESGRLGSLNNQIRNANQMVATLESTIQEATEIRQAGRKENELAIKDAQDAQSSIAQASAALTAFYKDSGKVPKESWELFLQRQPVVLPAEPSTWGASYTGVADPMNQPDGILTVLETIAADFSRMQADTEAQEVMDQRQFDTDMKDYKIEKARRAKESELKTEEKKRILDKISVMQKSRKDVSDQLAAVNQYLGDLSQPCLEGDSSYGARKAARQSEIDALKEAQTILANPGSPAPAPSPALSFLAPIRHVQ